MVRGLSRFTCVSQQDTSVALILNVYTTHLRHLTRGELRELIGWNGADRVEVEIAAILCCRHRVQDDFEMSVRMIKKSLGDRDRVEKIQGLLNELLAFLEDDLSIVTGSYQDLVMMDDVVEKGLILFVSLNTNKNRRACEALGKILLQNIQLMVGKRYAQPATMRNPDEPC